LKILYGSRQAIDKKERLFAPLLIIPFNPAKIAVFLFRDGEWSE